jgi:hypothetical protein
MKLAFVVYLLIYVVLRKCMFECKYATAFVDLCSPTKYSATLHLFLWENVS